MLKNIELMQKKNIKIMQKIKIIRKQIAQSK